jgi:hypothetical protein
MHMRVVRFTGVSADRIEALRAQVADSGGPPEGVPTSGLTVLFDADQGTAVVLQQFETAEDMEAGARVLNAMDPSETPGTRASVDSCEVALDVKAP